MNLETSEKLYLDAAANLFRGVEAVGGKLKVTNQRIYFKSHKLNIQSGTLDLPLDAVADVRKRNTMGIVPNGITILTKDGQEFKLVVWNRNHIINTIKTLMKDR